MHQMRRFSGSEVMGLMAISCRLAPTDDSLKPRVPDRLRHSLSYWQYCIMSVTKSQMFFLERTKIDKHHKNHSLRTLKNMKTDC